MGSLLNPNPAIGAVSKDKFYNLKIASSETQITQILLII